MIKVGVLKLGCIGSAPLIEYLLDERAEREDIDVRVVGSGAKLGEDQSVEVSSKIIEFNPSLIVMASPNVSLPGPSKAIKTILESKKPLIVVSDYPSKKALTKIEDPKLGYIIVEADSMIGARREFLDPIEMALFNSDVIKVLAITGAFRIIYEEIDRVIESIKKGEELNLPRMVIGKEEAVNAAGFSNPYAYTKAMASYTIASKVSELTVEGCFKIKEWKRYTSVVSAAHEMMRIAAKLAEEAREIEKYSDTVYRKPHYDDGSLMSKKKLLEKPVK